MRGRTRLLLVMGLAVTLALGGCDDTPTAESYPTGPSDTTFRGLQLELDVEPTVVAVGDTVAVTVKVTNAIDSTVTLRTPTTCLFLPEVLLRRDGTRVQFGPVYFCGGSFTDWVIEPDSTVERSREIHTGDDEYPLPRGEYVVASGFEVIQPFELPTLRHPFEVR